MKIPVRHRVDCSLPALRCGLESAWIAHEFLDADNPPPPSPISEHDWLGIVWCLSGNSTNSETGQVQYRSGHVTLLPPMCPYAHCLEPTTSMEIRYLILSGSWILDWCRSVLSVEAAPRHIILKLPQAEAFLTKLNDPAEISSDPSGMKWFATLAQVLSLVENQLDTRSTHDLIYRIRALIDKSPSEPWTLKNLAEALHLSPRTLSRQFQSLTGERIMD